MINFIQHKKKKTVILINVDKNKFLYRLWQLVLIMTMLDNETEDISVTVPLQPNGTLKSTQITLVTAYNNVELSRQVDVQFNNVCYSVPSKRGK